MKPKVLTAGDAIVAEGEAHGIAIVLARTVLEHVRAAGGSEEAMRAERRFMDAGLDEFRPNATARNVSNEVASELMRKKVKAMLDQAERYVRKELGLAPPIAERH